MPRAFAAIPIFTAQAATGNGTQFTLPAGGYWHLAINGTFGGTSFKLQLLGPDATNYIDIPGTTFTVAGYASVQLPAGAKVRGVLTGGAGMTISTTLTLI